ncbi:efflux RND transporter periplasmic adaptor subunit [Thalassotalea marina]|uniref:Hemolysin secretion protein D n=1 Tax=Thalassotalea marina TaxID=1673741 RepID=A0A919EIF8_9GAMM|nr:efflux RND transporter periplasmic adaptor subunit [Thalassotalea marina]GHF84320.1 hemolysin secretion protein D [Thalassotalea marina]
MKNKPLLIFGFALVISSPFIKLAADNNKQKLVKVVSVEQGSLKEHLVATGRLTYKKELNLDSQLVSTVTKVLVQDGDKVIKGQPLLEFDSFELDNQFNLLTKQMSSVKVELAIASTEFKDAQRKHDINIKLIDKGLIGKEQFDLSAQALLKAELNVQYAQTKLAQKQTEIKSVEGQRRYLQLKAPLDGLITTVNASVGENVYPNQMNVDFNYLISMVDDSAVYAEVRIDERSLANVRKNQLAEIYFASFPDKKIAGKVSFIFPTVDTSEQGLRNKVRIALNKADLVGLSLKQNMSCLVKLKVSETIQSVLVPMEAIVESDESKYVYVFDGEKVDRRFISVGSSDFKVQQVLEGVSPGESIVVGPMSTLLNLTDGEPVRVAI